MLPCLRQDWVYWDRHSLELTLELNPVMKPPAHEVAGSMWAHNLPALMRLMELVRLAWYTGLWNRIDGRAAQDTPHSLHNSHPVLSCVQPASLATVERQLSSVPPLCWC